MDEVDGATSLHRALFRILALAAIGGAVLAGALTVAGLPAVASSTGGGESSAAAAADAATATATATATAADAATPLQASNGGRSGPGTSVLPAAQHVSGAPVTMIRGITYESAECPGHGIQPEHADFYAPEQFSSGSQSAATQLSSAPDPGASSQQAASQPTATGQPAVTQQTATGQPAATTQPAATQLTNSGQPASGASITTPAAGADASSSASARSPLVILVHGGSFVKGSGEVDNFPRVATELAALGWSAASIDYCLPPVGTSGYPTEVGQVRNAISYFVDHAAEFRIDPRRIAVWGASAGASLALDSTTLMDRDGVKPIVAAVGWSGAYDLGSTPGVAVPIARIVDNYLGCSAAEGMCRTTAAGASAIRHILRGSTPPMYLANSTHELMPLEQLDAMRRALVNAGVPVSTQVIPGSRHAMAYTNIAFCPTVSFLERYLGATTGECQIPSRVVISNAGVRRLAGHTPSARRDAESAAAAGSAASAASASGRIGGQDAGKHGVGSGVGSGVGGDYFGIH